MKINLCNVAIDSLLMQEAVEEIEHLIKKKEQSF